MAKTTATDGNRSTREAESRASEFQHPAADAPWTQPASLEAPPPRQGMVQRWIRTGSLGKDDATNTSRKFREGWVPRKADTVPPDFALPKIESGKFAGCIGVEGMVLCEMGIERNAQRQRWFTNKRDRMTQAINEQLANESRGGAGFGRIVKDEKSIPVREVQVAQD